MSQKLSSVVGDVTEYWGTLREKKMGFCPGCFKKVLDMELFLEQIKDNLGRISQQKRQAKTPAEKLKKDEGNVKRSRKAKKRLFDDSPLTSTPRQSGPLPPFSEMDTSLCGRTMPTSSVDLGNETDQENAQPDSSSITDTPVLSEHQYCRPRTTDEKIEEKEENKDKGSGCLQDRGLEWNPEYEMKEVPLLTENQKGSIMSSLESDLFTIMRTLIKIPAISVCIRKLVLEDLQAACTELSSLKKPSILRSTRKVPHLVSGELPNRCIEEIDKR